MNSAAVRLTLMGNLSGAVRMDWKSFSLLVVYQGGSPVSISYVTMPKFHL